MKAAVQVLSERQESQASFRCLINEPDDVNFWHAGLEMNNLRKCQVVKSGTQYTNPFACSQLGEKAFAMKRVLPCLLLTVFSGLWCLAGESGTNSAPLLSTTNVLIKIRWNGATTKTVTEAAYGTTNRVAGLKTWEAEAAATGTRFTAILSPQEIQQLERVFGEFGGFKLGTLPPGTYTQEYVIEVSTGGADYHKELPFAKKAAMSVLHQIRACLNDQSRHPIDQVIRQVEGWMV